MSYPWPLLDPDPVLEEALNIALDCLAATGQGKIGDDKRNLVASSIMTSWRKGMRHRIQLANVGIVAVQQLQASLRKQKNENLKLGTLTDLAGFSLPQ
jgi:hypothetical protein